MKNPMNREFILTADARTINEAIATEIMGWKLRTIPGESWWSAARYAEAENEELKFLYYIHPNVYSGQVVWNPFENMADAWAVFEKVRKDSDFTYFIVESLNFSSLPGNFWRCFIIIDLLNGKEFKIYADGALASQAICRALLMHKYTIGELVK